MRSPEAFAAGHPSGAAEHRRRSANRLLGGMAGSAGHPRGSPGVDPGQAADANRQLIRLGFDEVVGYVSGNFESVAAGRRRLLERGVDQRTRLRDRLQRRERLTARSTSHTSRVARRPHSRGYQHSGRRPARTRRRAAWPSPGRDGLRDRLSFEPRLEPARPGRREGRQRQRRHRGVSDARVTLLGTNK